VVREENTLLLSDLMKFTLSVDHRVVDGALAAKFLNKIKELLETEDPH
jgi:pyruvate dehydrogenase E2 component (dihydrolipoamide acetyltransferase)